MGIWDFYFITKLFLYFTHYIDFHVWANLAFAACLLITVLQPRLKPFRIVLAVPVAVALFYYDTWFPPFPSVLSHASQLKGFDSAYLLELLSRLVNFSVLAALAVLYVAWHFARKKFRVSTFVMLAMLAPLIPNAIKPPATGLSVAAPHPASDPSASLEAFYKTEATRAVSFTPPTQSDAPFDIIFLHICSLSWDDLNFVKETDNPLFKRFNIVFTDFSSAASYSGPSVIRVLRGSCGQQQHARLYDPTKPQCQTFNNLQQIGFEPQLAMNHDGRYGNLLAAINEQGGLPAPLFDTKGVPPYLQSFDGTPVANDFAVLSKWWEKRLTLPAQRVALYYNSISLHDGNQYSGKPHANSLELYRPRLTTLLNDMDRFFDQLQTSGRRAVVVFVPEHGASLRGDKMQIAGMREIPSPGISIVPVGIKLIGIAENSSKAPLIVSQPSSYLAVSKLLADFVKLNPFDARNLKLADYVRDLPATEFVAENEDIVVMRNGGQYFLHTRDGNWANYTIPIPPP